jgi:hypothetical protein
VATGPGSQMDETYAFQLSRWTVGRTVRTPRDSKRVDSRAPPAVVPDLLAGVSLQCPSCARFYRHSRLPLFVSSVVALASRGRQSAIELKHLCVAARLMTDRAAISAPKPRLARSTHGRVFGHRLSPNQTKRSVAVRRCSESSGIKRRDSSLSWTRRPTTRVDAALCAFENHHSRRVSARSFTVTEHGAFTARGIHATALDHSARGRAPRLAAR